MKRLKRFWPQSCAAGVGKHSLNAWSTSVVSVNFKVLCRREADKLSVQYSFFLLIPIFSIDTANDWQLSWGTSLRLGLRSKNQVSNWRKRTGKISFSRLREKVRGMIDAGQRSYFSYNTLIMTFCFTNQFILMVTLKETFDTDVKSTQNLRNRNLSKSIYLLETCSTKIFTLNQVEVVHVWQIWLP